MHFVLSVLLILATCLLAFVASSLLGDEEFALPFKHSQAISLAAFALIAIAWKYW